MSKLIELVELATKAFKDRSLRGCLQTSTASPASDPISPYCTFFDQVKSWAKQLAYALTL